MSQELRNVGSIPVEWHPGPGLPGDLRGQRVPFHTHSGDDRVFTGMAQNNDWR